MSSSTTASSEGENIPLAENQPRVPLDTFRAGYHDAKGCTFGLGLPVHTIPTDIDLVDELDRRFGAGGMKKLIMGLFLLKRLTIGVATLDPYDIDLEAQADHQAVRIVDFKPDQLWDAALRDPAVMGKRANIVTDADFWVATDSVPSLGTRKMMVIGWTRRRIYVLYLIWFAALWSVGSGVIVGYFKNSLELGLITAGTVTAVILVMQGALLWYVG